MLSLNIEDLDDDYVVFSPLDAKPEKPVKQVSVTSSEFKDVFTMHNIKRLTKFNRKRRTRGSVSLHVGEAKTLCAVFKHRAKYIFTEGAKLPITFDTALAWLTLKQQYVKFNVNASTYKDFKDASDTGEFKFGNTNSCRKLCPPKLIEDILATGDQEVVDAARVVAALSLF